MESISPYKKLQHQVAGHGCGDSKLSPVVDNTGCFYKPLQNGTRGEREAEFYSRVVADFEADPECCSPSTSLGTLQSFVPRSYGTVNIVLDGRNAAMECLKLEDLTCSYEQPCVMDLKMGFNTWYKGCTEASREKYRLKDLKTTRSKIGFSVTGMQMYSPCAKQIIRMHKQKCRDISTREEVLQALRRFVSCQEATDVNWAAEVYSGKDGVLARLRELTAWFAEQGMYHFSSASVLVMYEGKATAKKLPRDHLDDANGNTTGHKVVSLKEADEEGHRKNSEGVADLKKEVDVAVDCHSPKWANGDFRVRLCFVDFAHAIEVDGERDTNVYEGLLSLTRALEEVVQTSASRPSQVVTEPEPIRGGQQ